jgi:hypothetical protein
MERIGAAAGYPRSEGNGYRYYYNGGKLLMDLAPVRLDQLPIAQAGPIAREYNEQLAGAAGEIPRSSLRHCKHSAQRHQTGDRHGRRGR